MKHIHSILSALVAALSLTACENFFDEKQLDNADYQPTDIRTAMVYTLTDDDVAAVGKQRSFKGKDTIPSVYEAKALSLCSQDDSTAYKAWLRIATEKAFNDEASADLYVPMLMAQKFPYLDAGTICQVTYPLYEGKSARVTPFNSASSYTLTRDDYFTTWGGTGAEYLSPAGEDSLPHFLATKFPTATEGKIMILTYRYHSAQPVITPPLGFECTVAELLAAKETSRHQLTGKVGTIKSTIYGRFYLVDGADSIYVYGISDEDGNNKIWKSLGIKKGDKITVQGKYSDESGEPQLIEAVYVSHTSSAMPRRAPQTVLSDTIDKSMIFQLVNGEWQRYANDQLTVAEALPQAIYDNLGATSIADPELTIGTYLRSTYLYPQEKQIYLIAYKNKKGITADEWTYNGSEFVMNTGYTQDVMSFVLGKDWVANISTYYSTPFVGDGQADFTIQHVALDGLNYVWRYQAAYGMTASAYVSGTNHPVEDWLLSPKIRLKKSVKPYLTFDNAVRYGNVKYNKEWLKVMVTNNFTGDVTTTEWEHLEFPDSIPDGSNWVFLNTGKFDLSKYNGESIVLGFQYNTTTGELTSAPTWEIQNLLVAEEEEEGGEE